ncbi:MAG: Centrosomal spindle body, CEP44-domain-containing protein [Monoraphidium minutum]|nr:MAG: Centrosomal spindle body, CEP44-domain-containing protein [Monoraphidium minutum]
MAAATGDIKGSLTALQRELRRIKHPGPVDEIGLRLGDPQASLPLLHHALVKYSRHVAARMAVYGLELQAVADQRFAEQALRAAAGGLGLRPALTAVQWMAKGCAESKVLLMCKVAAACHDLHAQAAAAERRSKALACRPLARVPEPREVRIERAGRTAADILRKRGSAGATDGGQAVYAVERRVEGLGRAAQRGGGGGEQIAVFAAGITRGGAAGGGAEGVGEAASAAAAPPDAATAERGWSPLRELAAAAAVPQCEPGPRLQVCPAAAAAAAAAAPRPAAGGAQRLVVRHAPQGGACPGSPCWQEGSEAPADERSQGSDAEEASTGQEEGPALWPAQPPLPLLATGARCDADAPGGAPEGWRQLQALLRGLVGRVNDAGARLAAHRAEASQQQRELQARITVLEARLRFAEGQLAAGHAGAPADAAGGGQSAAAAEADGDVRSSWVTGRGGQLLGPGDGGGGGGSGSPGQAPALLLPPDAQERWWAPDAADPALRAPGASPARKWLAAGAFSGGGGGGPRPAARQYGQQASVDEGWRDGGSPDQQAWRPSAPAPAAGALPTGAQPRPAAAAARPAAEAPPQRATAVLHFSAAAGAAPGAPRGAQQAALQRRQEELRRCGNPEDLAAKLEARHAEARALLDAAAAERRARAAGRPRAA